MGKHYLNREEKTQALTLGAFIAYTSDRAEEWAKLNRPKDLVKFIKTARTYAQKTLDEMCKDLNPDDVAGLLREVKKMQVVTRYNADAIKEYEAVKKMDSVTPVETDDLIDLVELGLASCSVCESVGDDADSCRFRKLFLKYDIQPLNCDAGPGVCPYRFAKGGGTSDT